MFTFLTSCIKGSFYSLILILCFWSTVDAMGRSTYIVKIPTASLLGICEAHGHGHLLLLQLPASDGNAQLVLRKIDGSGNKLWDKGLKIPLEAGQTIVSGSIARLPKKKYAMTAIRNTPTAGGNEQEAFILQLANDASIESQKRFVGNYGALVPLSDGDFVAAGSNNNSVASGVTIASMKAGGTVRWAKAYSGDFSFSPTVEGPQTLLVTATGELIFASRMASLQGTLVLKTDFNGNRIWSKRIRGAGLHFVSATLLADERIVLLLDQPSSDSIYLIGLNDSGDQVWTKSFTFSNAKTRGLAVGQKGSGMAIAGISGSEGFTATLRYGGTMDSHSYLAAPISAPAFMLYDGPAPRQVFHWLLAANTTQGGSMLFSMDPSAQGCSAFRSTPALKREPEAVYVVDQTLTTKNWNPNRGTSKLQSYTPSLEREVTVCRETVSMTP